MGRICPNTSSRATGHVEMGCRRRSLTMVGGRPGHGVQFVEVGRRLGEAGLLLQVRWAAKSGDEIVPLLARSRATTGFRPHASPPGCLAISGGARDPRRKGIRRRTGQDRTSSARHTPRGGAVRSSRPRAAVSPSMKPSAGRARSLAAPSHRPEYRPDDMAHKRFNVGAAITPVLRGLAACAVYPKAPTSHDHSERQAG